MKTTFQSRARRKMAAIMLGGSLFALSGCDPAVRATLLDGLQATTTTLSTALITAFFQSLEDSEDAGGLTTT